MTMNRECIANEWPMKPQPRRQKTLYAVRVPSSATPANRGVSYEFVSYVRIDRLVVLYIRNAIAQEWGAHNRKARLLFGGGDQRAPGLTIDQIVVSRGTQAYTPHSVSLYAGWLLLRANFPLRLASRRLAATRLTTSLRSYMSPDSYKNNSSIRLRSGSKAL